MSTGEHRLAICMMYPDCLRRTTGFPIDTILNADVASGLTRLQPAEPRVSRLRDLGCGRVEA